MRKMHLSLRGSRNYIHGPDIFDQLNSLLGPMISGSLQIYRQSNVQLGVREVEVAEIGSVRSSSDFIGLLITTNVNNQRSYFVASKLSDSSALRRISYDESLASTGFLLGKKYIKQELPVDGFSFAQRAVALNKILLTEITGITKWIFVRLDWQVPLLPDAAKLTLKFVRKINATYVTEIKVDGLPIAQIFFYGV